MSLPQTPPPSTILIVDDDDLCRRQLARICTASGGRVEVCADSEAALHRIRRGGVDVVITDLCMPHITGTELIQQILEIDEDIPCILMTGFGSADKAADALRAGAFWYLPKPFEGGNRAVSLLIRRACEYRKKRVQRKSATLRPESNVAPTIIGQSDAIRILLTQTEQVAHTDSTVLIQGESGTGKDLLARTIHAQSPRASKPFVAMNCGAIPEDLLESELFGHKKGSFTSATSDHQGRFKSADGGTLFLDEVGDMSLRFQVKLLRVLQTGDFEPVGSSITESANVRIVAATNQDLARAVSEKTFRSDLYYRLNVIPLRMPALRERTEDIPDLISHFVEKIGGFSGSENPQISQKTIETLCEGQWPGNVRELENVIERLLILGDAGILLGGEGETSLQSLGSNAPDVAEDLMDFRDAVDHYEARLILRALDQSHWNKSAAAEALGIKRTTLVDMVRRKGLENSIP